jgi:D-3-phosphoglycerate dehydrogenase
MPPQRPRLLIAESQYFSPRAISLLGEVGEVVTRDLNYDELLQEVRTADVLWVRLRSHIDRHLLDAAPKLRLIASPTTGLNHIDCQEAQRRGIEVISLRGERGFLQNVRATADLTIALLLALIRQLPRARASVLDGQWVRDPFLGIELLGKTVGVVGFGRLGGIVSRYLRAFDMTVLASDPHVAGGAMPPDVSLVPLERLLRESDVVTLHVDLSPATQGFFGEEKFAMMKKGSWFVNTSRGELVDEAALLHSLQAGHLSGAALDVLTGEYAGAIPTHPLVQYARQHDNLLITPHIGGYTRESIEKAECYLAEKVVAWMRAFMPALCLGMDAFLQ